MVASGGEAGYFSREGLDERSGGGVFVVAQAELAGAVGAESEEGCHGFRGLCAVESWRLRWVGVTYCTVGFLREESHLDPLSFVRCCAVEISKKFP